MPAEAGERSSIGVVILPEIAVSDKRKTAVFLDGGALSACVRAHHGWSRDQECGALPFVDELRRAAETAPRVKLPEVARLLWQAVAAGNVTEAEAEELSAALEARKALQTAAKPPQRRVGARPRSPASTERRRTWAARSLLPPRLAARFTLAEVAVLAVIAAEVRRRGACSWAVGHIAAVAGVSETTCKRALREARALGFITIEERRLTAWRNDTNVVRIVAAEWTAWLRLGGGGQSWPGTTTHRKKGALEGQKADVRGYRWAKIETLVLGRAANSHGSDP